MRCALWIFSGPRPDITDNAFPPQIDAGKWIGCMGRRPFAEACTGFKQVCITREAILGCLSRLKRLTYTLIIVRLVDGLKFLHIFLALTFRYTLESLGRCHQLLFSLCSSIFKLSAFQRNLWTATFRVQSSVLIILWYPLHFFVIASFFYHVLLLLNFVQIKIFFLRAWTLLSGIFFSTDYGEGNDVFIFWGTDPWK